MVKCARSLSPAFLAPDLRRKMTTKAVTIVAEGESAGNDFRRAAVRSASVPKQVRIRTDIYDSDCSGLRGVGSTCVVKINVEHDSSRCISSLLPRPSPLSVSSSVQTNETETEIHIWRNMAGARYKLSRRASTVCRLDRAAPLGVTFSPSHMEYQSCVEHAKWWW